MSSVAHGRAGLTGGSLWDVGDEDGASCIRRHG